MSNYLRIVPESELRTELAEFSTPTAFASASSAIALRPSSMASTLEESIQKILQNLEKKKITSNLSHRNQKAIQRSHFRVFFGKFQRQLSLPNSTCPVEKSPSPVTLYDVFLSRGLLSQVFGDRRFCSTNAVRRLRLPDRL